MSFIVDIPKALSFSRRTERGAVWPGREVGELGVRVPHRTVVVVALAKGWVKDTIR